MEDHVASTEEGKRLSSCKPRKNKGWKKWGTYLSDRQWGTVREDYSKEGDAWNYLSYDHSRSYAYRWGEDGLAGFCDDHSKICLSLALWNGKDYHLKEKLFGLTNPQGNHGEDVKELYFFLDATPTHSYCKMQYLYPQAEFPYDEIIQGNAHRGKMDPEYELIDTGVFAEDRYFEVNVEYAKGGEEDIVVRYSVKNCGPEEAELHVVPQLILRNVWVTGKPEIPRISQQEDQRIILKNEKEQEYIFSSEGAEEYIFCENRTNRKKLYGAKVGESYPTDGFHRYLVDGDAKAVNPEKNGTKCAAVHRLTIPAGETQIVEARLTSTEATLTQSVAEVLEQRKREADEFYEAIQINVSSEEDRLIQRQSLAGMMWTKQFYEYNVREWLEGDPLLPVPPKARLRGRNTEWEHLNNADVISMPDGWEYPWYAAWDLAFHCIPLALIDADFAKGQLEMMLKDWYMHPNGQIPAYEWNFSDVNPPVHAWACFRVFQMEQRRGGEGDFVFLEKVFHKLLINFTWWVNRKDVDGNNVFQGGFLGLDNIGIFDRSAPLPKGGRIDQADGTAWMAFYCLSMMRIALELATRNPVYEESAMKFFEHFLHIAKAINSQGSDGLGLWDEKDGFYYDMVHEPGKAPVRMKIQSMVGIIPLYAVEVIDEEMLEKLPYFANGMEWVLENRPDLAEHIHTFSSKGRKSRRMLSLVNENRLQKVLEKVFAEKSFYSDFGVRSLSKDHEHEPFKWCSGDYCGLVRYLPGVSDSNMFGGNSNWRGPIWFPLNYLFYESLQKYNYYYGEGFKIATEAFEGDETNLNTARRDLAERLTDLFREKEGKRVCHGDDQHEFLHKNPLFYEFFNGDNGKGLGAAHQTGWTGLVSKLIQSVHENR